MDIISFRSVLVLGGLCFLAGIVWGIADGRHQKTKDISYSFGVFLMLATFGMATLWILKVGTHGVRYLVHEVQTEKNQKEERQQEEAERQKRENAAAQQTQPSKQPAPTAPDDSPVPDVNGAAVMAGLLTQIFQKQGSDVTVMDLDSHTMLFDCTKEFDPSYFPSQKCAF